MDGSSHWVDNARIADLTCVLFHYKFLDEHFHEQAAQAVREGQYWNNSAEYKKHLEVLESNPTLRVKQETSKEIESVNELMEDGFLVVSEEYVSWVDAEEEKSILPQAAALRGEPSGLAEAFLESRRQERAKSLEIQSLKRQQGAKDLEIQSLKRQLRKRERKIQSSKRNQQRLKSRLRRLKGQLKGARHTRSWKLAKMLGRIKARVTSLRRGSS
jgi:chromosome segregation ATPase